eukprot:scaffold18774_cov220-Cylindrotheca_fusiformis.AAC.3
MESVPEDRSGSYLSPEAKLLSRFLRDQTPHFGDCGPLEQGPVLVKKAHGLGLTRVKRSILNLTGVKSSPVNYGADIHGIR